MRPILLVGGAPRLTVDAVRYLSVRATGTTAVSLHSALNAQGIASQLRLSEGAGGSVPARRYVDRADLDVEVRAWIEHHPDGVVVMSAAVNDYRVAAVELALGDDVRAYPPGAKIPSGGDELIIRLRPTDKLIDQLTHWGLTGPVIGFKYEAKDTVIQAARQLQRRTNAALVVANSLCGSVQTLVDAHGEEACPDRATLIARLTDRLVALARSQRNITI